MVFENFASLVQGAHPSGRGYRGICPACGTNNRSKFSFVERDGRILVHCHAGCATEAICVALGVEFRDLFVNQNQSPRDIKKCRAQGAFKKAKAEVERMAKGFQIDCIREGEKFLKSTVGMDISQLDEGRFDTLMTNVCDALAVLIEEERSEYAN
jgi:hypothetical protein